MKTKTFRTGFCYTQYGVTNVKAKTVKQAELKLKRHLNNYGLDKLKYSSTDRDIYIDIAEEIK